MISTAGRNAVIVKSLIYLKVFLSQDCDVITQPHVKPGAGGIIGSTSETPMI